MRQRIVATITLVAGGLALSACGTPSASSHFVPSKNCSVTVTNYDLAGCNLSHRNLSHDDLQSDDFENANLSGANLDFANLQGANVKGAKLKGVKTNALTICVNAESGPCTNAGLNSASNADESQGD
jgi:uncharacterized protein YjbI with pentapeptide repeats